MDGDERGSTVRGTRPQMDPDEHRWTRTYAPTVCVILPDLPCSMRIRIARIHGRHRLHCVRSDGSHSQAAAGPDLPHHDLAHYVAERTMRLKAGFFGAIAAGRSIDELSDPAVIRTLPREAWDAEILARTLQGTDNGTVKPEDFITSVTLERGAPLVGLDQEKVALMTSEFDALLKRWQEVPEGGALELEWM